MTTPTDPIAAAQRAEAAYETAEAAATAAWAVWEAAGGRYSGPEWDEYHRLGYLENDAAEALDVTESVVQEEVTSDVRLQQAEIYSKVLATVGPYIDSILAEGITDPAAVLRIAVERHAAWLEELRAGKSQEAQQIRDLVYARLTRRD